MTPDQQCHAFVVNSRFEKSEEQPHIPSEADLEKNGSAPKNSIPSKVKSCCDGRGMRCIYYYKLSHVTEYYSANEGLCLYSYKR